MPQASQSLKHRNAPLSVASEQLRILNHAPAVSFPAAVESHGFHELTSSAVEILQVNVGKLCNMTCRHCHVDAGPDRREIMTRETIDDCLAALRSGSIHTLDLTGGAPEMNPDFRYFVTAARNAGVHVIDRCNLTILLAPQYEDMAAFLAEQQVEIVASLPCYLEENTDSQRGDGAYRQSIEALRLLNELGYGHPDSGLRLTLVFNPVGASLPPEQASLEAAYRDYLRKEFQIEFNRLFTITNMPISRYLEDPRGWWELAEQLAVHPAKLDAAIRAYRTSLALSPAPLPALSHRLSQALLLRGELQEGFQLYEQRPWL